MHFSRVRSAVGARLSAVVVCAALVAGLSACDGGGGTSPTAPAAEAPTPLDGVLCDVLPTDLLSGTLGFDSYTYAYFHHPISGGGYDHPGYYYVCMLQSDYTTWAMLEITYDPDDTIPHQTEFGHKVGSVEFDRVPEIFPNAEPVDIDGQDGRGWAWAVNNTAYVFWLYPDGQSLSMFLCKRVRSEMGVDSVGVGGGEPGGPAGGALRLVVTRPVDESTRWPCASGRACSSPWRAPRPGGPSGVADPPATAVRAAASSEEIVAAPLGGPRGSVAGRLGRRWWCRGDPAQGRGEGQEGGVPLPGPLPRPPPSGGARTPGSDWRKAPGARRAASSSGAVQARAPGGGDPLAVPVGDEPHGWRGPGWTTRAGDHGVGPGPPRAASGRPAGPSQHTISTPRPRPCWPDRAHTRRPSRRPPPRPRGSRSSRPRARAPSMPRAHGDAGSGVPGTRWPARTIGADRARGGPAG